MAAERAPKRRRLSPPGNGAVPGFAQWDLEQDYERKHRGKKAKESDKLPVKTAEGWKENQRLKEREAEAQELAKAEGEDADSFLASDDEAAKEDRDSGIADIHSKPRLPPKEEIRQAKEDLARIAAHISENLEENIGQLSQLAEIARSTKNLTVRKLALGTQLAVYKDIIPGYRIRPLSKDDLAAKVSKDVKKLRAFEQGLLGGYKQYVSALAKAADDQDAGIRAVAVGCASVLVGEKAHFNMRNELVAILVKKIGARNLAPEAAKCVEAIERLFREDEEGHASLEVVGQVTKMMKAKNYHVHESVLNTFLHLRLLSEFSGKASTNRIDNPAERQADARPQKKKDRVFRTKRERKVMKERKGIEKEMREADAAVSFEERDKNQAETLKLVFVAYFRILKARVPHLMGAVLEGLARYSHLINQEFFGDILEVLRELILESEASEEGNDDEQDEAETGAEVDRDIIRERLLCIITAFALLQGQQDVVKSASTLQLDLDFFITHLYRLLLPLAVETDLELGSKRSQHLSDPNGLPVPSSKDSRVNLSTTTVLLLRSLSAVLLPPQNTKSVPPIRVAAFLKHLMTLSLHLPQKSAQALMALLSQVVKTHGGKVAGLWNSEERRGDGVWDPLAANVEGARPFAGSVWEGEVLRVHWDEKIREGYLKGVEGIIREVGKG